MLLTSAPANGQDTVSIFATIFGMDAPPSEGQVRQFSSWDHARSGLIRPRVNFAWLIAYTLHPDVVMEAVCVLSRLQGGYYWTNSELAIIIIVKMVLGLISSRKADRERQKRDITCTACGYGTPDPSPRASSSKVKMGFGWQARPGRNASALTQEV